MKQKVLLRYSCLDEGGIPIAFAQRILSDDELARAAKFRLQLHRNRYIRSRAFVRTQLGSHVGVPARTLAFRHTRNGKPYLAGGPHFNFSRSGPLGVLAISDLGPVGVDLEQMSHDFDLDELAEDVLNSEEIASLNGLARDARRERFLLFWTAKEAFMKLVGKGVSLAPLSIKLTLQQDRQPHVYESPSGSASTFTHVRVVDAICCVATRVPKRDVAPASALPIDFECGRFV